MAVRRSSPVSAGVLFGLARVGASLGAIAAVAWLVLGWDRDATLDRIREHGTALSAVLAVLPADSLRSDAGPYTVFDRLVAGSPGSAHLAYAVVGRPDGTVAGASFKSRVRPPVAPIGGTPDAWQGERRLRAEDGTRLVEYHAPILQAGELAGFVRLGYAEPGLWLGEARWRVLALIALPVFLLVPLFDLFRRGEMRGARAIGERVRQLAERHSMALPAVSRTDVGALLQALDTFVADVDKRFTDLEYRESQLRTTGTVLEYRQVRLLAILESLPLGAIVIDDSHTGVICNALAADILGVTEMQIMGRPVGDWCPIPDLDHLLDRAQRQRALARAAQRGSVEPERLSWRPRADRETLYEVIVRPLIATSDRPVHGILVALADVTEQELARRARGEFVGHVAHELKAPLQVLGMYAETLKSDMGEERAFQIEAANVIDDEVRRLGDLIHNMLSLTQIEMGSLNVDRQRVRVGEFLADVFESATRSASADGIRCVADIAPDLSALALDKSLLRMALNNLIVNAIKYNRPGGEVRLEAEELGDAIVIRVRDSGIGISEADQARIFDRFWRVESDEVRARSGHGLGLTLARDIVQLHHGTLSVDSTPGVGSTFTIRLGKEISMLRDAA